MLTVHSDMMSVVTPDELRLNVRLSTPSELMSRLVVRKYVEEVKLVSGEEYSIRFQQGNKSYYFPLGTCDETAALKKAAEIEKCVLFEGLDKACRIFPREITVAVFWSPSPLCCTYTTTYAIPNGVPDRWHMHPAQAHRQCKVVVVHPEPSVLEAIKFWVDRQPGFCALREFTTVADFMNSASMGRADLLLVYRDLMEDPDGFPLEQLRRQVPNTNVFAFGIYEESNYIFHSVTGVKSGYILCRRPPGQLFEPARSLGNRPKLPQQVLEAEIQKYFKTLFQKSSGRSANTTVEKLTAREHDVMMGMARGFTEKELALKLQISPLTVHNHAKRIYSKLNVHSRTEAVLKYLQTGLGA